MLELYFVAGAVLSVGFHSECINTAGKAWRTQHLVLLTKPGYCDGRTRLAFFSFHPSFSFTCVSKTTYRENPNKAAEELNM